MNNIINYTEDKRTKGGWFDKIRENIIYYNCI